MCTALLVPAGAQFPAPPASASLAPYVPTPQDVVDRMLALANVTASDVVYDLGCGDGRIVVTAAKKFGARGIGVDFDPERIKESQANAKAAGVEHLVTFKLQDAMTVDVSPATVVTLYLLSSSNTKLRPILTRQLKPGSRSSRTPSAWGTGHRKRPTSSPTAAVPHARCIAGSPTARCGTDASGTDAAGLWSFAPSLGN